MQPSGPSRPSGRSTSSARRSVGTPSIAARADVVAATFANADLTATRAALNTYYAKFLELDDENRVLRQELEQHDVDSLKVTSHLEQLLDDAHLRYDVYKSEATAIIQRLSESEAGLRQYYETLLEERDKQLTAYADAAARLQSDLLQASRYVQQRQAHAMELKQLQEQLEEMAEKHEKELTALRFETIDRKMRLVALERTMKEEFQNLVDEESTRLLEVREAALLQYSRSLEQEKHDMAHDIEELMDLTNLIDSERTVMRRTADVHQQTHREVLRQVAMRNRQGREQELKAQRLEAKVRDLSEKQQTIAHESTAPYKARVATLETELAAAQSALADHRRELKQMRRLAKRVVSQRTDLERFFYTALEDCKRYRVGLDSTTSAARSAVAGATMATGVTAHNNSTNNTNNKSALLSGAGGVRGVATMPARAVTGGGGGVSKASAARPLAATAQAKSHAQARTHSGRISSPQMGDTFHLTQPLFADGTSNLRVNTGSGGGGGGDSSTNCAVLPPVRSASPPPPPPAAAAAATSSCTDLPSDGSHFEDLPWGDKEKVIKALFFFINSTYYGTRPGEEDGDDGDEEEDDDSDDAVKCGLGSAVHGPARAVAQT